MSNYLSSVTEYLRLYYSSNCILGDLGPILHAARGEKGQRAQRTSLLWKHRHRWSLERAPGWGRRDALPIKAWSAHRLFPDLLPRYTDGRRRLLASCLSPNPIA